MTEARPARKAIRQSTLVFLLNAASVLLITLCCVSFYFIVQSGNRVNRAAAERYDLFHNAQRFLDASGFLTDEVRACAATGERIHYDNYWNEVNVAKNRDIAVRNMRDIGITYHEGALVAEMHALSDNLIPLEKNAMDLAAAGKTAEALDAVYGWSYEDWISRIRAAQTRFIRMLNERTEARLAAERRVSSAWTAINLACLAATALIQAVSVFVVRSRLIRPLVMVRDEMLEIERGNLSAEFDATPDTSEMGMLIGSMKATKSELNRYRREIGEKLAAIADGDASARIDTDYPGDFREMKDSINEIARILAEQRERDERSRVALREAYDAANAANEAKSNFLSGMSHEIRTPMNAIIGMTAIALASGDPERRVNCLRRIEDASTHLLGVINDILDMSKIDSGKFELSPAEFRLKTMLDRVVNIITFRVDEKRQKLRVHLDPEAPASLIADDQRLAQVFTNLLSNAVKFTAEEGEIGLEVRLLHEDEKGCRMYAAVTDTGIGISPERQKQLFTSFTQADAGIARKYGGTGLGLAISRSIVEKMDGRVWVESEEGKGSKFALEFIAVRGTMAEEPGGISGAPAGEGLAVMEDLPDFTGRRILLAEDNEVNREIVYGLLEPTGVGITSAENGAVALEVFAGTPEDFDLIFMDMHMPEMDGNAATAKIRALDHPYAKEVPIIAMTANVFREDIDRCLEVGMNDHLGKPLNFVEVLEKMKKYLGRKP